MPIIVEYKGVEYEFADGTPQSVIQQFFEQQAASLPTGPAQKTVGQRWSEAKTDPAKRAEIAKEIGRRYAEITFAPNLTGFGEAFAKTGADILTFGMGRREIQQEARKAFPGMTEEESRMVAQVAEEMQLGMQPLATPLGAATGLVGQIGGAFGAPAVARGVSAAASKVAPSATNAVANFLRPAMDTISKATSALAFRPAAPTAAQVAAGQAVTAGQRVGNVGLNLARGGALGAGGGAAYEAIGAERNPLDNLSALIPSAAFGAVLPYITSGIGAGLKRMFAPKAAARDVLESEVGRAVQQPAERFTQATQDMPPVAGAVIPPNAAARASIYLPEPQSGLEQAERGIRAVNEAAQRRIQAEVPPVGMAGTPEQIAGEATAAANRWMGQNGQDVINTGAVRKEIQDAIKRLGSVLSPSSRKELETFLKKPTITIREIDGLRTGFNALASKAMLPGVADDVREIFRDIGINQIDPYFPGYTDTIIDNFAETMRRSEGAALAPQAFTQTPQTFERAITQNIPTAQMPERMQGVELALEELIRQGARTPEEAIRMMRLLSNQSVGQNIRTGMPSMSGMSMTPMSVGASLSRAAPAYTEAAENIAQFTPVRRAQMAQPDIEQVGQAAREGGTRYFGTSTAFDLLKRLAMPASVRRQIMELLTNPNRTEEAITAMMRAAGKGMIPEMTQEGIARMFRRQVGRGVPAAQAGIAGVDNPYADLADVRPNLEEVAKQKYMQLLTYGKSPKEARDEIVRLYRSGQLVRPAQPVQ